MKKSKLMRVAALLMVAVLLTTCAISGTFAKYIENANTEAQTARVAKWGVKITADATGLFASEYAKDDANFTVDENSVETTGEFVVAPGTSGEFAEYTLTGTPEVAVRVSFEGTLDLGDNWKVNGEYYCPLEITVDGTTFKGTDPAYTSVDEFEAAVNAAIAKNTKDYAPLTDLSTVADDSLEISWAWAFDGNNDAKDTALGDAFDATISLTTSCEAVQSN